MVQISLRTKRKIQKFRPLCLLLSACGVLLLVILVHQLVFESNDDTQGSLIRSSEKAQTKQKAGSSGVTGVIRSKFPNKHSKYTNVNKFRVADHQHKPNQLTEPLSLKLDKVAELAKQASHQQQQTRHPNDNLVVGIMVTNVPRYIDALQAQQETWLDAHIPPERAFVVAGEPLKKRKAQLPRYVHSTCDDRELYCKRMMHIIEAHRLLDAGTHFDWLLSGNEDWYVNVPDLQTYLAKLDPNKALLIAFLGCGKESVEARIKGKNHTCEPMLHPPTGGICAGDGVFLSRAAVEVMMRDGAESLWKRTRAQPFDFTRHPQDDPVLSCVAYSFPGEIKLVLPPWEKRALMKLPPHCPSKDCYLTTFHAIIQTNTTAEGLIRRAHRDILASEKMRQPRHPNDNLLVAVMASNVHRYTDVLQAQQETWLDAYIPPDRVFAVAGEPLTNVNDPNARLPRFVNSTCSDIVLYCKRMMHIIEAHRLLNSGTHFDWLLSVNEDLYVNVPDMQKGLKTQDPSKPLVLAILGCGKELVQDRIQGKNHTCEPILHPPAAGICGGAGVVLSRAAVEVMMRDGADALWKRTREQPFDFSDRPQDDPVLSCVVHSFGEEIQQQLPPWELRVHAEVPPGCPTRNCKVTMLHTIMQPNATPAEVMRKAHKALSQGGTTR